MGCANDDSYNEQDRMIMGIDNDSDDQDDFTGNNSTENNYDKKKLHLKDTFKKVRKSSTSQSL